MTLVRISSNCKSNPSLVQNDIQYQLKVSRYGCTREYNLFTHYASVFRWHYLIPQSPVIASNVILTTRSHSTDFCALSRILLCRAQNTYKTKNRGTL